MTVFALVVAIVAAGAGGELFVRGTVGLAAWARVPAGIVAATVAAFATSSPELSVAVSSAVAGEPEIALGDALGSNVVNVAVVLGVAIVLLPLHGSRAELRRDLPFAFAAPVLTGVLLADGTLGRADALVLFVVFGTWFALTVLQAHRMRSAAPTVLGERRHGWSVLSILAGLGLLVVAGRMIVSSAESIGRALDVDPFVIGATVVAFGTSTPELATTIVARLRGHEDVGVGTVIGSNIFNNLWIVAVAALIRPITVRSAEVAVGIVAGVASLALVVPGRAGVLPRWRGIALLALYGLSVVVLFSVRSDTP